MRQGAEALLPVQGNTSIVIPFPSACSQQDKTFKTSSDAYSASRACSLTRTPPKPEKGNITAFTAYVRYQANQSKQPNATRARLWVRFIRWSFLNETKKTKEYTGWKKQTYRVGETN